MSAQTSTTTLPVGVPPVTSASSIPLTEKPSLRSAPSPDGVKKNDLSTVLEHEVFAAAPEGDGPDYRAVSFWGAFVLLLKSQIGLGVLSLPHVLNTLGIVPGLLVIIFLGIATTYGDYEIGRFCQQHPGIHSVGDVGLVLGGRLGREILGWSFWLYQCFNAASGMLAASIALNALSLHGTCTVVFALCAAIIVALVASIRTFHHIAPVGWVGIFCIIPAILLVTIACGVSDRPPTAPAGIFDRELRAFASPSFSQAMVAVVNVLFSYGGSPGYFQIRSEMKDPRKYTVAVLCSQGFSMALYISISVALWHSCGKYVASPALGSAGPLIKRIAYGIAFPGLLAGPIIYSHLAIMFCFVKFLRGTIHLQKATKVHWITWISLVIGVNSFSFIIAMVIPFFNDLIGLIGALFGSIFCLSLMGCMWLYDNKAKSQAKRATWQNKVMYVNAWGMIIVGLFILVAGFYGTVVSIKNSFETGAVGAPFSCADNSNSV